MMNRTPCMTRRVDCLRRKGPRRGRDNKAKWPVGIAEAVFGGNNLHCVRKTVEIETVAEVRTVPVNETERSETLSLRKTRANREFRTGSEGDFRARFKRTICGRTSGLLEARYLMAMRAAGSKYTTDPRPPISKPAPLLAPRTGGAQRPGAAQKAG